MASPSPLAPTGTDLDIWFGGGLPRGSLTLVEGSPVTGKTTFLICLVNAGAWTGRRVWIGQEPSRPSLPPNIDFRYCERLNDVIEFVGDLDLCPDDLLVIDDLHAFPAIPKGPFIGYAAERRAVLSRLLTERGVAAVVSSCQARPGSKMAEGLGKGVAYCTGLALSLERVARTGGGHTGAVVRATVRKSKISAPNAARNLWLRPDGPCPIALT